MSVKKSGNSTHAQTPSTHPSNSSRSSATPRGPVPVAADKKPQLRRIQTGGAFSFKSPESLTGGRANPLGARANSMRGGQNVRFRGNTRSRNLGALVQDDSTSTPFLFEPPLGSSSNNSSATEGGNIEGPLMAGTLKKDSRYRIQSAYLDLNSFVSSWPKAVQDQLAWPDGAGGKLKFDLRQMFDKRVDAQYLKQLEDKGWTLGHSFEGPTATFRYGDDEVVASWIIVGDYYIPHHFSLTRGGDSEYYVSLSHPPGERNEKLLYIDHS